MLSSMQMNHAIPRNAAAAMDDGRSANSGAFGLLESVSGVIVTSVREVLLGRVLWSVAS